MPPTLNLKPPAKSLAICFIVFVLGLVLVGTPGPCSFSGLLGDSLARTAIGDWFAYAIVVLPLVGTLLSVVWLVAAAVVRLLPSSNQR